MYRSRRLFLKKVIGSLTPSLPLSAKSHACYGCSLVNAITTPPRRYQLFAGLNLFQNFTQTSLLLPVDSREPRHAIRVRGFFFYKALVLASKRSLYHYLFTHRRKLHIACGDFFLQKSPVRSFRCASFSEKGHSAPSLFVPKRARDASVCYQPFSVVRGQVHKQNRVRRLFCYLFTRRNELRSFRFFWRRIGIIKNPSWTWGVNKKYFSKDKEPPVIE